MLAMRWAVRLLGVLNVVILARLLDQDSFGVMAMAGAVVALPITLAEFGLEAAIIKEKDPTRGMYNTAWTIQVIKMTVLSILLFILSPYANNLYHDPRISHVLMYLALMVFISGFENIWVVHFRKTMNFRADFIYNTTCKILVVLISIAVAIAIQSYWAMVIGQILGSTVRVIVSMVAAPERPVFTLSHWRNFFHFGKWVMVQGIAGYCINYADRVIIGRHMTAAAVGAYSVGREVSEMPLSEISAPINRVLLPALSSIKDDKDKLPTIILKILAISAAIIFPIGGGLAAVAGEFVEVVLGVGWEDAVPILRNLSLSGIIVTIINTMSNVLIVMGFIALNARVMVVRAVVFVGLSAMLISGYGIAGVTSSFIVSSVVGLCVSLYFASKCIDGISTCAMLATMLRPALACGVMVLCVIEVEAHVTLPVGGLLASKVIVGAISYSTSLFLFWQCTGRPYGLESIVLEWLRAIVNHRARRP